MHTANIKLHIASAIFVLLLALAFSLSLLTSSPTYAQDGGPSGGPGQGDPPEEDGPLIDNACVTDSYFGAVFYDEPNFTDPTASHFRYNISENWNASAPESGMSADRWWSAHYAAGFSIVADDPNGPPLPPGLSTIFVTGTFAGTLEVRINGTIVKPETTALSRSTFVANPIQLVNNDVTYILDVFYQNQGQSNAELELRSITCDESGNTCGPERLFFGDIGSGPSRPDRLYYSEKISDVTEDEGPSNEAQFSMRYENTGPSVDVQWQRKELGSAIWNNVGFSQIWYIEGPPLLTSYSGDQYRAQLRNGVCQFTTNLHTGTLTVDEAPTYDPLEVYIIDVNDELVCPGTGIIDEPVTAIAQEGDPDGDIEWTSPGGDPAGCDPGVEECFSAYETTYDREGLWTITAQTGIGPDDTAFCQVDVRATGTPTPTPSETPEPLQIHCPANGVPAGDPVDVNATGGDPEEHEWTSTGGIPPKCTPSRDPDNPNCFDKYTTTYDTSFIGQSVEIRVERGTRDPAQFCNVEILEPELEIECTICTGSRCPQSGTFTNKVTIRESGNITFVANNRNLNFPVTWEFPSCATPRTGNGTDYTAFFDVNHVDPPIPGGCNTTSGPNPNAGNEIVVTNGPNNVDVCNVEIDDEPTPTPTDPPQCFNGDGSGGGGDGGGECEPQEISMFVFDVSPISQLDCNYQFIQTFPTATFPLECDPHLIGPNAAPPVNAGQTQLELDIRPRNIFTTNTLLVLSQNLFLSAHIDDDREDFPFPYSSIFVDDGDLDIRDHNRRTLVGQVNAYNTILKEYKKLREIWPITAAPANQYDLPGLASLFVYVDRRVSIFEASLAGIRKPVYRPQPWIPNGAGTLWVSAADALDSSVILNLLYGHILVNLSDNTHELEFGDNEDRAIIRGLSLFYSGAFTNTYGDFASGYENTDQIDVLDLPTAGFPYPFLSQGGIPLVFEAGLRDGVKYVLSSLRIRAGVGGPQVKILQKSVLAAHRKNTKAYYDGGNRVLFGSNSYGLSRIHSFYLKLYIELQRNSFDPVHLRDYRDLLYDEQKIGLDIGNYRRVDVLDILRFEKCEPEIPGAPEYPVYKIVMPTMSSIGSLLSGLNVVVKNTNGTYLDNEYFSLSGEAQRRGMHVPIDDLIGEITIESTPREAEIELELTNAEGRNLIVEVPGTFQIPSCPL